MFCLRNYILFILLVLQLVFVVPVVAVEENTTEPVAVTTSAEATPSATQHKSIPEIISDWFGSILGNFFAAKYKFSDSLDTSYGDKDDTKYGDMTTRAIPDTSRTEEKNKYIRQFITGKYKDINIDPDKDHKKCNSTVTLRELTVFLLNTSQPGIKSGLSGDELKNFSDSSETKKITLSQSEECYRFLYDNFYMIPQDDSAKTAGSEQLNRSFGNLRPNRNQSTVNVCNNDSDEDCAKKNKEAKIDASNFFVPENQKGKNVDGFNMLRYQNQ